MYFTKSNCENVQNQKYVKTYAQLSSQTGEIATFDGYSDLMDDLARLMGTVIFLT
jgi:hypothetical protein